jgi:hypothetical protein
LYTGSIYKRKFKSTFSHLSGVFFRRVGYEWGQEVHTMDLHELAKIKGEDAIADVIGCQVTSFRNKRSGQRPLSIDDLYAIKAAFSEFDIGATVIKIGRRRSSR